MAGFSSVDDSPDPGRLVRFLDFAAAAESGMKHYAAAVHALRRPERPILDIGCGTGHDLELLTRAGLAAIGVDPSRSMLEGASLRLGAAVPLVRADGGRLPFPAGSLGGCRIERVLMHVVDPAAVLAEVVRCLGSGALLTVFEPDWSRFEVRSAIADDATWLCGVRHPDIGGRLWQLLEEAGCDVLDRVEELSVWRSLSTLVRVADFPAGVHRASAAGRITANTAARWIGEQREREAAGTFCAVLPKIMVVAQRRSRVPGR